MVGPASASVIVLVAVGECTCARLAEVGGQAFQAFEQLKLTALLTSLTSVARLLAAAGMVLVLHHATVRQWVIASLCVSCLSAAVALVLVTTRLGWPKVNLRLLRERALEGVGFSIAASTTSVYNDLDKAMLSRYGMLAANGIYSMAYRVIDMSCTPIRALQSAAFPRFCQTGRNGARSSIAFTHKLLGKTLPFGLLAAAAMFLAAPIIPHIVGRSFTNSVSALRWLCLLPVFPQPPPQRRRHAYRRRLPAFPHRRAAWRRRAELQPQPVADPSLFMARRSLGEPGHRWWPCCRQLDHSRPVDSPGEPCPPRASSRRSLATPDRRSTLVPSGA